MAVPHTICERGQGELKGIEEEKEELEEEEEGEQNEKERNTCVREVDPLRKKREQVPLHAIQQRCEWEGESAQEAHLQQERKRKDLERRDFKDYIPMVGQVLW